MIRSIKKVSIVICIVYCACKNKTSENALFESMHDTGIEFTNTVKDNDTINILNYRNFYNGGGVAIGDINNDGSPDVFFTANQGSNKLFLNKGNWKFEDISAKAGFNNKQQFSTGVVMADINNDSWLDIFVCNAGSMHDASLRSNQLFINNHDLTFTESAAKYGLQDSGYTTQVSFFDYDMDGDLDCFKIDNSPVPVNSLGYPNQRDLPANEWKVEGYLKGGGDHLFRNDNGFFTEVTQQAGIHGTLMSFGLGVTVGDINGDNYPDVYVANDFFERDYLYINQQNGTFKDELETWMQHNSYASMGADFGDINNDGFADIFTTDMLPADDYRLKTTLRFDNIDFYRLRSENGFYHQFLQNTLQLNIRNNRFADIANYSGVSASEWSWGALLFDADNDGLTDIYVCNGIYRDLTNQDFLDFDANEVKEQMVSTGKKDLTGLISRIPSIAVPNKMFHNLGNLKFSDEGANWGFTENSFSNGAAYGDLDNDGDLDIVVNNVNEPALIFKNNTKNNYIGISLKGKGNNSFAIGAKIIAYKGSEILTREVIPSRGFQSSVDYRQVIGIGNATKIDSLIIIWPDLTYTKTENPAINQYLAFSQPVNGQEVEITPDTPFFQYLYEVATNFQKHVDDGYTDFYQERAIPQMLSHEGPKAAVADVNGDGLDDIYIGGGIKQPGQLYLQQSSGNFIQKLQPAFLTGFVDGAVLFFDCDGDKDQDLLLCAAGNTAAPASRELQHRLFINDGKGNFQLSASAFPLNKDNTGVAVAFDFDKDGDKDVFTGGRCVTGVYGMTPLSHIYINDGKGIFKEMPADNIREIGMVTGAVWANDELVIVGEWMYPHIFKFEKDHFTEIKTNLDNKYGWWQTVSVADMNGDGKQDLILGNLGENFYLRPDEQHPVRIWLSDFDQNGQVDKIISRFVDGKDKPVFMKNEAESELPGLKKQNLHHAVYATKSVQDLFTPEELKKTVVKQINYSSSCIAYNKGNGQYDIQPLPPALQFSSVKSIVVMDLDNNNTPDLVTGGNEFNFQPQLGRLDASTGDIVFNDGKGKLSVFPGLNLHGQVRDIVTIKVGGNDCLLFLQNNEYPVLYNREIQSRNPLR